MTQPTTNACSGDKEDRLKLAIDLRRAGVQLTEIGKRIGHSKSWTCKLLKEAGVPPTTVVDKNGTRRTKHGMRHTSEYSTWISMRTRCLDPNHPTFPRYGGRGIAMDLRWLDFHVFLEDMGRKPAKGYTLERVDNDGDYCQENCIWLPKRLQNRNQSTTILNPEKVLAIRAKYAAGITQTQIAKEYGLRLSHVGSIVKRKCWKDL